MEGNAETFSRPGEFDVILHFGTLYSFAESAVIAPNDVLAICGPAVIWRWKHKSLIIQKTQTSVISCIGRITIAPTSGLSVQASSFTILALYGFTSMTELAWCSGPIEGLAPNMKRIILTARKPALVF